MLYTYCNSCSARTTRYKGHVLNRFPVELVLSLLLPTVSIQSTYRDIHSHILIRLLDITVTAGHLSCTSCAKIIDLTDQIQLAQIGIVVHVRSILVVSALVPLIGHRVVATLVVPTFFMSMQAPRTAKDFRKTASGQLSICSSHFHTIPRGQGCSISCCGSLDKVGMVMMVPGW
jgi:hypothetical protein